MAASYQSNGTLFWIPPPATIGQYVIMETTQADSVSIATGCTEDRQTRLDRIQTPSATPAPDDTQVGGLSDTWGLGLTLS